MKLKCKNVCIFSGSNTNFLNTILFPLIDFQWCILHLSHSLIFSILVLYRISRGIYCDSLYDSLSPNLFIPLFFIFTLFPLDSRRSNNSCSNYFPIPYPLSRYVTTKIHLLQPQLLKSNITLC